MDTNSFDPSRYTMKHSTDIDLDFADRQLILDKISNVPALLESGKSITQVFISEIQWPQG